MAVDLLNKIDEVCRETPKINVISCLSLKLIKEFIGGPRGFEVGKWSSGQARWLAESFNCRASQPLLNVCRDYLKVVEDGLRGMYGGNVLSIDATVDTRLTIHVKWPYMPLEIAISWHPILNVPYIPASSIKGAVRAYAEINNVRICGMGVDELFGHVGEVCAVAVTDAYPVGCVDEFVEADIVNPHYREAEGKVREIDVKPTPLVYPVVARDVVFRFFTAFRRVDAKCFTEILNIIKNALEEGLGARTRLGYGVLRFPGSGR